MSDIDKLKQHYLSETEAASDLDALEAVRVAALGKKGAISELLKTLGRMSPEERQTQGPIIQGARGAVADAIAARKDALERAALDAQLAEERIDMTLPAPTSPQGSVHPVSQVMDELAEIFADLGFAVATGPEIETDWYNFTALNIPETHPARAEHDTFYTAENGPDGSPMVLRTHTSPVQIRTMQAQEPPIRIIAPGRTYRSDSDATHTPMFHQVEGLVIDRGIHMGHLKWTLETFVKAFFERDDIVLRLRPSYFPFTEPSAEVDVGFSHGKRQARDRRRSGRAGRRLDGDTGLWDGASEGDQRLRAGPRRISGLRLRLRHRPAGHAEIRDGRSARLFRRRSALAEALRLLRARHPHAEHGSGRMKFTLNWLKEHLEHRCRPQDHHRQADRDRP